MIWSVATLQCCHIIELWPHCSVVLCYKVWLHCSAVIWYEVWLHCSTVIWYEVWPHCSAVIWYKMWPHHSAVIKHGYFCLRGHLLHALSNVTSAGDLDLNPQVSLRWNTYVIYLLSVSLLVVSLSDVSWDLGSRSSVMPPYGITRPQCINVWG